MMAISKESVAMKAAEEAPPVSVAPETIMTFDVGPGGLLKFLDVVPKPPGRIRYRDGRVTIVSPSLPHEEALGYLDDIVETICDELEIPYSPTRSTLFRRDDLERGVMPDASYYLEHHGAIDGVKETVDLRFYPPPDLVLEVVRTHGAAESLEILSAMGVAEVWVYEIAKPRLRFLQLDEAGAYVARERSRAFRFLSADDVLGRVGTIEAGEHRYLWKRCLRQWARETLGARRAGGGITLNRLDR